MTGLLTDTEIPKDFYVNEAFKSLDNPNYLDLAFLWDDTPQGAKYWAERCNDRVPMSDKDILQIQKWIINYYRHHQN
jgi:hypothetical protein